MFNYLYRFDLHSNDTRLEVRRGGVHAIIDWNRSSMVVIVSTTFMTNKSLLQAFFLALVITATPRLSAAATPLPRSSPEAQGVSSQAIREYIETADKTVNTMHSFMLVRHGHVIAEAW